VRRFLILVALALAGLSSCAAKLTVSGTGPLMMNAGACLSPILSSAPVGSTVMMHFAWTGPSSGEDSLVAIVGQRVTLTRTVPAGTYTVRGWASNPYGAGCDTTITRTVGDPPATLGVE